MKPLNKTKIEWSSNFAYAIGLLVTDGNLSKDGRHIDLTSGDREQLENFLKCLNSKNKICFKHSGSNKKHLRVQLGDVNFYKFLLSIGLMPNKTKIIGEVKIPKKYFFDFLRGHLDGDGSFYSYWDPRWKSSYMFYTTFLSASKKHILWLQKMIFNRLKIKGRINKSANSSVYQLRFAKAESVKILRKIYYKNSVICLSRKKLKIQKALSIVNIKL